MRDQGVVKNNQVFEVSREDGAAIVEQLSEKHQYPVHSVDLFSGNHTDHGRIYVVFPATGNAIILPIDIQNSAL
jgi:NAD(P)H-hydrate repair Nnr-like enzyme with NAD(P)H-hydrate epimerase domain